MLKKQLIFIVISCFYLPSFGQVDSLVDKRDGRKYAVVQIGETRWFKDFLKYETALSHCPNFNKKEWDCEVGNYYSYLELDTICPQGWHVITGKEWREYYDTLRWKRGVKLEDLDSLAFNIPVVNVGEMVTDTTDQIQLFSTKNAVNLRGFGWVQGRRIGSKKTSTFWINKEETGDSKYHLHLGKKRYIEHTHVHNLIDKRRKVRKFMVKCVCD